jgi:hypothetical protein
MNPSSPSTFKVSRQNLMTAQRLLLDQGSLGIFHQSIGSLTLLDDYRRWRDRVFLNELYKCYSRGQSNNERGGYYFPGGLSEAELANPGYDVTTAGDNDRAKFSVKEDWLTVVTDMRSRNIPTYSNGYYRVLADPVFCKHLRQDSDYREVARYPGSGMINPMMPMMQPNAPNYMGFGPAYGQAGFVGGAPTMPTGTLWEGCQVFETTNMAEYSYNVAINGARGFVGNTPQMSRAAVGFFFGPQCIGLGIGGQNAQILINSNDDFSRFVILVWQLMAGWEVLNYDFCTVAHSFIYHV